MMYEFNCSTCKRTSTVSISMSEYDIVKRNIKCCGLPMSPVVTGGIGAFLREPFPRGKAIVEHCMDDPVECKDKKQLADICAESGTVSRYLEDDV